MTVFVTVILQGIYRYAGRNFLIWDIEPQGCLPYTLTLISHTEADLDANGCLRDYNDNAIYFNGLLKTALTDLQNELTGSTIVLLSTYDLKTDLFANATANGEASSIHLTAHVLICVAFRAEKQRF